MNPLFTMLAIYAVCIAGLVLFMWWKVGWRHRIDDPKAAVMPLDHLQPEPRTLRDLSVGETVYTNWTNISVNSRGAAFVDLSNSSKVSENPGWHTVEVRREADGWTLRLQHREDAPQFTPRPIYAWKRREYEPVIRIEAGESAVG
jgi:hypothetical protein